MGEEEGSNISPEEVYKRGWKGNTPWSDTGRIAKGASPGGY